ncbi:thiamine pyrophosphokinase 1 [Procambarus clarkii]|uniref:thiamine pyrophosphokinase 1 n=1 Tax=Procambarus clarkii TaxID=6728 RepID=UPI003742592D
MENGDGRLCWEPKEYYHPSPGLQYAVIVLNEALDETNMQYVNFLWRHASVRVCVDGATNSYHNLMQHQSTPSLPAPSDTSPSTFRSSVTSGLTNGLPCNSCPLPDIITGDFDSAQPELLKLYSSLGVNIVPTPSQDETDFTKAVRVLEKFIEERNFEIQHVVVIAGLHNTRFDHVIANIATLYKIEAVISVPVVVISGGSLYWLLTAGDHSIQIPEDIIFNPKRSWCGLVPVGQPSTVTTTGLKWNLNNQVLAFGHMVSTSNTFDPISCGLVTITTSKPLLWTMGWNIDQAPTLQIAEEPKSSCCPNQGIADKKERSLPTLTHLPTKATLAEISLKDGKCPGPMQR